MAKLTDAEPDDPDALLIRMRALHCAGCAARLERVLARLPGVARAEVRFLRSEVRLVPLAGAVIDRPAVLAAIEEAGFYPGNE